MDNFLLSTKREENSMMYSIKSVSKFHKTYHYGCKVRDEGHYISKAFHTVLGVNIEGKKEILGLYLNKSEGAKFWLQVLTDLQNRGVEDILIASVDGLKGFPEAINAVFPETEVQLCIVHQIRNSLKYIASKNQKQFAGELKKVYTGVSQSLNSIFTFRRN